MSIHMVKTFVVGIFPRSPKLINTWKAYDRREVSEEEFMKIYLEHLKTVIDLFNDKGLDIIHDPQSNWHDHFRPFTRFKGLEAGPLTRFYENNTFYRRPIFNGEPEFSEEELKNYLSRFYDRRVDGVSIPGPYMWIKHSIFKGVDGFKSIPSLVENVVGYLIDIGYRWIFLHEPSIVYYGANPNTIEKLYRGLMDSKENLIVYTYFGRVNEALKTLWRLGFNFSIDMRWNRLEDIDANIEPIILGIVDGQNTLIEDPNEIRKLIFEKISSREVWLCNNVDLDFLPYEYALKKVEILSKIKG